MSDNNNNEHNQPPESELLRIRREKLLHLRSVGLDPYAQTTYDKSHSSAAVLSNFEALEGQTVSVAGRMMSKRVMRLLCLIVIFTAKFYPCVTAR